MYEYCLSLELHSRKCTGHLLPIRLYLDRWCPLIQVFLLAAYRCARIQSIYMYYTYVLHPRPFQETASLARCTVDCPDLAMVPSRIVDEPRTHDHDRGVDCVLIL